MDIIIEPMNKKNSLEIFQFELDNKEFFESMLPPRPDGYFDEEKYSNIVDELLEECKSGDCYLHLIRDAKTQKVIGRINLSVIKSDERSIAELGYRVAENVQGKGIASKAVEMIKKLAFDKYNIHTLEAGTSTDNIGSQRVLVKNGFVMIGEEKNVMKINEKWVDGLLYECKL